MSELTKAAGLPRPEFESIAGAVVVRFRPGRYEPPLRAGIDLTERQRAILAVLAQDRSGVSRKDIAARLPRAATDRQVKEALAVLKQLGLVDFSGRANLVRWKLLR